MKQNDEKNIKKRAIGLHIRLQKELQEVIQFVQRFETTVAQSFLLNEQGAYVSWSDKIMHEFVKQKKSLDFLYFIHAAYWSSLAKKGSKEFFSLLKEAQIAADLQSSGIVVHIGATRAQISKQDQALYVAEALNELTRRVANIPIVLENSPHAGRNFGGDFTDFQLLLPHIEQKNRVVFCIDTAHAFVFGYDLSVEQKRETFFQMLSELFNNQNIALIHINDAAKGCGSLIDKHEVPGVGQIGQTALIACMKDTLLQDVPIIMELPASQEHASYASILKEIQQWDERK